MKILLLLFVLISCQETKEAKKEGNLDNDLIINVEEPKKEEARIKNVLKELSFDSIADQKTYRKIFNEQKIKEFEIEGTLNLEYDDFNNRERFHINNTYITPLDEAAKAHVGRRVLLRGEQSSDKKFGYIVTSSSIQKLASSSQTTQVKKMLVLLFYFQNADKPTLRPETVHEDIFEGTLNHFFRDISGEKYHHIGDVKGWYKINRDESTIDGMNCKVKVDEIKAIAQEYNLKLQNYDVVTYVSNCNSYEFIGGRTSSVTYDPLNIGKDQQFIEMASNPYHINNFKPSKDYWNVSGISGILMHERGHNFGLQHSDAYFCGDKTISHDCKHIVYGNPYDTMGNRGLGWGLNAYQLVKAGFRNDNDLLTITQSGTYSLDKLSSKKKGRKIGAYIVNPVFKDKVYLVEYRNGDDYDPLLTMSDLVPATRGLMLYTMKHPPYAKGAAQGAALLDPHPGETSDDWGTNIKAEALREKFTDPVEGIDIEFLSIDDETKTIKFKVDLYSEQSVCLTPKTVDSFVGNFKTVMYEDSSTIVLDGGTSGLTFSPRPMKDNAPPPLDYKKVLFGDKLGLMPGDDFTISSYMENKMENLRCNLPKIKVLEVTEELPSFIKLVSPIFKPQGYNIKEKLITLNEDKEYQSLFRYKISDNAPLGSKIRLKISYQLLNDKSNKVIVKPLEITIKEKRTEGFIIPTLEKENSTFSM